MNKCILGDNIEVMNSIDIKIDFMLWDPPYNTGSKDFMYNDKFFDSKKDRHSKWLSFMEVRLELAKKLLKDTGAIAVHISYHELFRLGLLMDEIFGEDNRLGIVNWECAYSPKNDNKGIPSTTDYILIYAKNKGTEFRGVIPRTEAMNSHYKNPDDDSIDWKSENFSVASGTKEYFYGIENPITKEIHYPPGGRFWSSPKNKTNTMLSHWGVQYAIDKHGNCVVKRGENREKAKKILHDGPWPLIFFGQNGLGRPAKKLHISKLKNEGRVLGTYWEASEILESQESINLSLSYELSGHNAGAKKLIKSILGEGCPFDTPKPLKLTERLVQMFCPKDGIVLDAFGGSATTAHAVLSLNAQNLDCNRTFILIEQDKTIFNNVTIPRINKVISGDWAIKTKSCKPLGGKYEIQKFIL